MIKRKVLILSYFFPPSGFTSSFRIHSWVKHLHENGYYPVIVTRKWELRYNDFRDMSISSSPGILHEKTEQYELYQLPYRGNFRDKIFVRYGDTRYRYFRKILSAFEVLLTNISPLFAPYRSLYVFSRGLLKKDKEIEVILTSGQPYALFGFCNKLSKTFGIPWVADYRDDWNTSQWLPKAGLGLRLLQLIETPTEKRWLSSASHFTTVSEDYVRRISALTGKAGTCIMNGLEEEEYSDLAGAKMFNNFTILFNGTLYDTQPIELFIQAYKSFIDSLPERIIVHLLFLGLGLEEQQSRRVQKLLQGYELYYKISNRYDKKIALRTMSRAHVFLMLSHSGITGVTSSKIFDYLALKKPIILCPSDYDVLESLVTGTRSGIVCNSSDEILRVLQQYYQEFQHAGKVSLSQDENKILEYSRRKQTQKLAAVLDKIVS